MSKWIVRFLVLTMLIHANMVSAVPSSQRSTLAADRVREPLREQLQALGANWGAKLYLRIFKASDELEVWVDSGARYRLLRRWPICTWSGELGPKLRQGDGQAPRARPSSSVH